MDLVMSEKIETRGRKPLPLEKKKRPQATIKVKKQQGYSEAISLALKELEINLTPPPQRKLVRYGLMNMRNQANHGK